MAFVKRQEQEMIDFKERLEREKKEKERERIEYEKRDSIDSSIGKNNVWFNEEIISINDLSNLLHSEFDKGHYTISLNTSNGYTEKTKGGQYYENQQRLIIDIDYLNTYRTNFSKEKMKDMFEHFREDIVYHWSDNVNYNETSNGIVISMYTRYNGITYNTKIYLKDNIFKITVNVSTSISIGWYNDKNISIDRLKQIHTIVEKCVNVLTYKERFDTEWDF